MFKAKIAEFNHTNKAALVDLYGKDPDAIACVVCDLLTESKSVNLHNAAKELAAFMGCEDDLYPDAKAAIKKVIELGCIQYTKELTNNEKG